MLKLACGLLCLILATASPLPLAAQAVASSDGQSPSLETMLGSMLMLGFRGMALAEDDLFLAHVRAGRVGHVVLFERSADGGEYNITSPEQVRQLTAQLRDAAPGPMLIAVDQEGGAVRRLTPEKGFMDVPSAQRMGQEGLPNTVEIATRLGQEMHSLGINCNLAPVVDVNINPSSPAIGRLGRSFNTDARQVARHALAFGQAQARQGIIPCLKHFPGHGSAMKDSHTGLPDISKDWNGGVDLVPYAEAFAQHWPGMVMVGHLYHRGLDPRHPAPLSRMVVTGLLRQGLGWQGVVISDDMQMKAITDHFDMEQAMLLAVNAGVDILVYGNIQQWDAELPQKVFSTLRGLVEKGQVTPQRIEASWRRIRQMQQAFATR